MSSIQQMFFFIKLTFVNEIATLCEMTGADIEEVTRGIDMPPE
ncbi:MAG: hypothetical protein CM15mP49_16530 [Actinomycetota bacterium]|nr:MAG: hypothetical protein CM15mP49_16530 [Actinomycetota bacterium]